MLLQHSSSSLRSCSCSSTSCSLYPVLFFFFFFAIVIVVVNVVVVFAALLLQLLVLLLFLRLLLLSASFTRHNLTLLKRGATLTFNARATCQVCSSAKCSQTHTLQFIAQQYSA